MTAQMRVLLTHEEFRKELTRFGHAVGSSDAGQMLASKSALILHDEALRAATPMQTCRDCGEVFPYDPEADRCPSCVADNTEPPCNDPRPDPRTHPEYWTE